MKGWSVEWTGLNEQFTDLKSLATDMALATERLATNYAANAARDLREAYPRGKTGHLRAGVKWVRIPGGATVLSSAPHAHFFEKGTKKRYATKNFNQPKAGLYYRGRMKRRFIFKSQMAWTRNAFMQAVKALLPRFGLEAKGNAA